MGEHSDLVANLGSEDAGLRDQASRDLREILKGLKLDCSIQNESSDASCPACTWEITVHCSVKNLEDLLAEVLASEDPEVRRRGKTVVAETVPPKMQNMEKIDPEDGAKKALSSMIEAHGRVGIETMCACPDECNKEGAISGPVESGSYSKESATIVLKYTWTKQCLPQGAAKLYYFTYSFDFPTTCLETGKFKVCACKAMLTKAESEKGSAERAALKKKLAEDAESELDGFRNYFGATDCPKDKCMPIEWGPRTGSEEGELCICYTDPWTCRKKAVFTPKKDHYRYKRGPMMFVESGHAPLPWNDARGWSQEMTHGVGGEASGRATPAHALPRHDIMPTLEALQPDPPGFEGDQMWERMIWDHPAPHSLERLGG